MRMLLAALVLSVSLLANAPYQQQAPLSGPTLERDSDAQASANANSTQTEALPIRLVRSPEELESAWQSENKTAEREEKALEIANITAVAADRQADLSAKAVGVSALGAMFVFFALLLSHRANKTAQESLALAKGASRAELMPYVHAVSAEVLASPAEGVRCRMIFENSGRTPALNVEFGAWLDAEDFLSASLHKEIPRTLRQTVGVIPPDDKRSRFQSLSQVREAFDNMRALKAKGAIQPRFTLRGYVYYSAVSGDRYVSDFLYSATDIVEDGKAKLRPVHVVMPTYQEVDEKGDALHPTSSKEDLGLVARFKLFVGRG